MRRDQLEHLIRAAGQVLEVDAVIVIGSQAILASGGGRGPAPSPVADNMTER